MRKIYFLILLLSVFGVKAQIVTIPDANFKQLLVENYDTDFDGEIQVSEALAVTHLDGMNWPNISSIEGVQAFENLQSFYIEMSPNVTDASPIYGITGLTSISFSVCGLTQIDLSYFPLLTSLNLALCPIATLDLSHTPLIETLYFGSLSVPVSGVDLTLLSALNELYLFGNTFTALPYLPTVTELVVMHSPHTNLDVSGLSGLQELSLQNNMNIIDLNLKTGGDLQSVEFSYNPNLQRVCANAEDISQIQTELVLGTGNSTPQISNYCNFTPGGGFNTISGTVRFDSDGNGCDASDIPMPFTRIGINDGSEEASSFSNNSGNYLFYTDAGDFTLYPILENPTYFNVTPVNPTVSFPSANNLTANQDFCLTANGTIDDVEVIVSPIGQPVVGNQVRYQVTLRNKGNQVVSQIAGVSCSYDYTKMDLISTSPIHDSQGTDTVFWNYTNLQPFETRTFYCVMEVHTPMDPYPVNIGDEIEISAAAGLPSDVYQADNQFVLTQEAVSSYDPNDILCLEGDLQPVSAVGDFLHYRIRFENTGTAPAQNVVLKMAINPAKYNVGSLQMLQSSHGSNVRLKDNILEIIFENINLDSGGHGNVLLKMRSDNGLQNGDLVSQRADIYFDYNFPVLTNDAETVFSELSASEPKDSRISLWPNPAKEKVVVSSISELKHIEIYDVQGRLLQQSVASGREMTVDLSGRKSGMYLVKVVSREGASVFKVMKE